MKSCVLLFLRAYWLQKQRIYHQLPYFMQAPPNESWIKLLKKLLPLCQKLLPSQQSQQNITFVHTCWRCTAKLSCLKCWHMWAQDNVPGFPLKWWRHQRACCVESLVQGRLNGQQVNIICLLNKLVESAWRALCRWISFFEAQLANTVLPLLDYWTHSLIIL